MKKRITPLLPYIVAMAISIAFLLLAEVRNQGPGYPLDDAWIHQTYARNLALNGKFAFVPGQVSAGSTSPLWTLLLAPGYWLKLSPYLWSWILGILSLLAIVTAAAALARTLYPETPIMPQLAALVVATEWHLIWSAASGMETGLFSAGVLGLLALSVHWGEKTPAKMATFVGGVLIGLLALVRPEGILLSGVLGVAILISLWHKNEHNFAATLADWRLLTGRGLLMATGIALTISPYIFSNLKVSGTLFPNTFYAKQQEYNILYSMAFIQRLLRTSVPLLPGVLAMLLPALPWSLPQSRRDPQRWLPLLWVLGTWVLYAWRLPVKYQHGRYLMPIIPPLLVYGTYGLLRLWRQAKGSRGMWILTRAWAISSLLLVLAFLWIGSKTLSTDIAIINGEMVAVAQWLDAHTPDDTIVAAHDIGALGYFSQRPLLDLAGLVSPEVIPFIRDEEQLLAWIEQQNSAYLITFPSWYPQMVQDPRLEVVYQNTDSITQQLGEDNMVVYRCNW